MVGRGLVLVVAAGLLGGPGAHGDLVVAPGKQLEGQLRPVENDPSQVEINVYWSRHPQARWGTERLTKQEAKVVREQKRPADEYFDQALALKADDAAGHAALAEWCKKTRRPHEATWHAERALAADPAHEAAIKVLGSAKAKKFVEQRARWTKDIEPLLRELLAIAPQATDADAQRAAVKEKLAAWKEAPAELVLDRLVRSQQARRGLHQDLQMRMDVGELRRCIYTLLVPKDYDPLRSYPLVLGLHGGGPGPTPTDDPVGSGKETMPFYVADATSRGYIVVCPDAIVAGWHGVNDEFIDKLLREIVLTYNVDLRRVFVMGHSMGGWGTWYQGPRLAHSIAAFSPNSGGGPGGYKVIRETQTAVYQYHGDNDDRCKVDPSREAAKQMKRDGIDFIYTELPGSGHGWPKECIAQSFDLFDRRRTFPTGEKLVFAHPSTAGFKLTPGIAPASSLELLPLSKPELTDLGGIELGKKSSKKGPGWKDLVAKLTKGGELGLEAAGEIGDHDEKAKAVPAVIGLLTHESEDTRVAAATALGRIGDPRACKPLGEATKEWKMRPLRRAAIGALGAIGGAEALPVLKNVLRWQAEWFDGVCGGDRTRADNWQWNREEVALIYGAVTASADAECLDLVRRLVVEGMVLRTLDVAFDPVAHQKPELTRRRYVEDCARFVGAVGRPEGAAVLDALARCGDGAVDAPDRRDAAIGEARAKLAAAGG